MSDNLQFVLPAGRLISGDLVNPQTVDYNGRPKTYPNIWFAVAVSKTPDVMSVLSNIWNFTLDAWKSHPNIVKAAQEGFASTRFHWKIEDGDASKWLDKHGAGCYVFKFSTSLLPLRCSNSDNIQIDPATIKLGYYVDVAASIASNEVVDQPGIYLNPHCVRLLGHGQIIQTGPSIDTLFGGVKGVAPAGASAVPVASQMPQQAFGQPQQAFGQPQQAFAPQQAPFHPFGGHAGAQTAQAPQTMPFAPVPAQPTAYPFNPHPGFLNGNKV
ncbi:MAG: hypothetical protein WC322_01395 [Candidatus Paceibacterota bacterium]|jgi:hypothetical protein